MRYRSFGKTGLEISILGLGLEHLRGQPRETIVSTIHEAVERGINYYDVIFSMNDYLEHMGTAFRGMRDRVHLAAHLGSTNREGQYYKSRALTRCRNSFHALLERLETDYVDFLFLHNFNTDKDWRQASRSGGFLDLALQYKEEGKARFLGVSGHDIEVIGTIVETGLVDVVMFPINLFNHAMPYRRELLSKCAERGLATVAMKPFSGGKLLKTSGKVRVPKYQMGGTVMETRVTTSISPVQCLSYVISQAGVTIALPGVKNQAELREALQVLDAGEEQRDFSPLLMDFARYVEGECTYCNHCLPCPEFIDIGQVNRLLDEASYGMTPDLRESYRKLPNLPSECTECGACVPRCPFEVDIIPRLKEAVKLFEEV